jgi:hypothetical protein
VVAEPWRAIAPKNPDSASKPVLVLAGVAEAVPEEVGAYADVGITVTADLRMMPTRGWKSPQIAEFA